MEKNYISSKQLQLGAMWHLAPLVMGGMWHLAPLVVVHLHNGYDHKESLHKGHEKWTKF